jgi:hypothetical protein
MARNQEKAQSMMNRYLKGKQDEETGPKKLRPFLASEVSDIQEADKWHHQIVREISRKVSEIQNSGLGEHRCEKRFVQEGPAILPVSTLLFRLLESEKRQYITDLSSKKS